MPDRKDEKGSGSGGPRGDFLCEVILRFAGALVPSERRKRWLEEWRSELWYEARGGVGPALRCLGAIPHALWIRGEEWNVDSLAQDLRYAAQGLLRRQRFAAVTILTLAVGIGGTTAIFSIVDSVLLRPLPIPTEDRLVWMWGRYTTPAQGPRRGASSVSPPDYLEYRDHASGFEELAATTSGTSSYTMVGGDGAQVVSGRVATANLLDALGLDVHLGRSFLPEEELGDRARVALISHDLWQSRFGGDPGVLGRTLPIEREEALTIVGVLPPGVGFPVRADFWTPPTFGAESWNNRAFHFLRPVGLLAEGADMETVQAGLDVVSRRLEVAHPDTNDDWYANVVPVRGVLVGSIRAPLMTLMAAVGLVLLMACANVANLLLARAADRREEMAIRAAMGASRLRIVRQLLTESVLLSVVAGGLGVLLAAQAVSLVQGLGPSGIPRLAELAVDGRALLFTLAVASLSGIVFGLAPALQLSRARLAEGMGAVRGGGDGPGGRRLRRVLVVAEMATSVLLLVGAALLMRSFAELRRVDPGLEPRGVVVASLDFPENRYPESADLDAARGRVLAEVAGTPRAQGSGGVVGLPFTGSGGDTYIYADGNPPERPTDPSNTALSRVATPGYFATMGIDVVAGREFDRRDARDGDRSVILNESLAARLFGDQDPVGRRVQIYGRDFQPATVVGVVADVKQFGLATPAFAEFWLSASQSSARSLTVVARLAGDPAEALGAVRAAVLGVDPDQPLARLTTVESLIDSTNQQRAFQMWVLGAFAVVALFLAAVGVYGLLAHAVGRRSRDIGLRMAVGAQPGQVVGMVLHSGLTLVGLGIVLGVAGALATSRLLSAQLYGVTPLDLPSFVGAPVVLGVVALLASYFPARRAARVDPVEALRSE